MQPVRQSLKISPARGSNSFNRVTGDSTTNSPCTIDGALRDELGFALPPGTTWRVSHRPSSRGKLST